MALLSLLLATPAVAIVPEADRVEAAVAEANLASGRGGALRLELSLQIGDGEPPARAELVSHPTGLARLELREPDGSIERQLLQGSALAASRDALPAVNAPVLLPPFFVLQAESAATLRAALASFGVLVDVVGLADCGESDCLVLGDPAREVPRPALPELKGLESLASEDLGTEELAPEELAPEELAPEELGDESPASDELEPTQRTGEPDEAAVTVPEAVAAEEEAEVAPDTRLWVELESYEIRGMDLEGGVRVRLGPIVSFDRLRVPAWFSVEQPGQPLARFQILGASRVTAPASVFSRGWLLAPVVRENTP